MILTLIANITASGCIGACGGVTGDKLADFHSPCKKNGERSSQPKKERLDRPFSFGGYAGLLTGVFTAVTLPSGLSTLMATSLPLAATSGVIAGVYSWYKG